MTEWDELVEAIADCGDLESRDDAERYVTPAACETWLGMRLSQESPAQILSDICEEVAQATSDKHLTVLLNVMVRGFTTELGREAELAVRRLVARDLTQAVDAARLFRFDAPRARPDHGDLVADDRRALAREASNA